ncbi:MAG: hypothetical protein KAG53_04990 [Endozoicomonadaceae bacterium]|nr:hypothetical protein [Endozoicomonadaceae bacterium]
MNYYDSLRTVTNAVYEIIYPNKKNKTYQDRIQMLEGVSGKYIPESELNGYDDEPANESITDRKISIVRKILFIARKILSIARKILSVFSGMLLVFVTVPVCVVVGVGFILCAHAIILKMITNIVYFEDRCSMRVTALFLAAFLFPPVTIMSFCLFIPTGVVTGVRIARDPRCFLDELHQMKKIKLLIDDEFYMNKNTYNYNKTLSSTGEKNMIMY